jgi:DNA-binding transcriptional MerR regulator
VIPEKLFYKIGEVAALTSLKPSVLRFWETEFAVLQPQKSRTGQRLYSNSDVAHIMEIKRLLYTERLTIEGARQKIAQETRKKEVTTSNTDNEFSVLLQDVRSDLYKIRELLVK